MSANRLDLAAAAAALRERMRENLRIGGEPEAARAPGQAKGDPAPSFGAVLEKTALSASEKQHDAVEKAEALARGQSDDLHGTMITMKEAEIAMRLVGSVRDRLLDAFHELWRINV
jgi:flagellar hook-basal body complex protein FliE